MTHRIHRSRLGSALKLGTVLSLAWSGAASAQTYTQGVADGFVLPTEAVSPSTGLQTWVAANYPIPGIRPYDQTGADRYFATTFPNLTQNGRICGATLRMTVRNGGANDSMGLWFVGPGGTFVATGWGESLVNLGIPFPNTGTVVLNLAALPGTGVTNLIPTLNAQGFLDIIVQDDSAVDSATLVITPCRRDVFIKDIPADVGVEPGAYGGTPIWMSPDIRVCTTPGCVGNQNPEFGQTNYVYVKLNNVGTPSAPLPQSTTGTLRVYYTGSGGAALWPSSWATINSITVSIPPGVTEVMVPWNSVPAPGHYCLLARWDSPTFDPMTFPELINSNTLLNTERNNNLAWRNVNVVNLSPLRPAATFDFRVLNVLAQRATLLDLLVRVPGQASFISRGEVLLNVPAELWQTWSRKGEGFEVVGNGLLRITNPGGARLIGLTLGAGKEAHFTLTLKAQAGTAAEKFELQLVQLSETEESKGQVVEVGGVGFDINVGPEGQDGK